MAINLYGYSTQRISGLFSGMDTESLVNNVLAADQLKLDKLFRQKEKAQWKLEAYTELNTIVSNFRNTFLSVLGEKSLMKAAVYNAYKVNMAETSAVKVTGSASALPAGFKILSTARATAASSSVQVNSQQVELKGLKGRFLQAGATGRLTPGEGQSVTADTTIEELAAQFGLSSGQNLAFSINGETFTFERTKTLGDIVAAVNASEAANVQMSIDYDTLGVSIASKAVGADSELQLSNITGSAFAADKGFGLSSAEVKKVSILSEDTLSSHTFAEIADMAGISVQGDTVTINGVTFSGLGTKSARALMDEVNAALEGVTFSYDANNGTFVLRNNADSASPMAAIEVSGGLFGEQSVFGVEAGSYRELGSIKRSDTLAEVARKVGVSLGDTLEVTINGKAFTFSANTTLSDMMSQINRDSDVKAVFSYSEMMDSFQISSAQTGSAAELSFSGFALFGLEDKSGLQGTDARMVVSSGGVTREIVQTSNTFTLDGLTFEILEDQDFGEQGISVSVERDYQPTVDAVKAFIEAYNEMVGKLTTKYYEKTYSDYPPLTEEQRSELSEKEAEKWDEKAKSGILRNDAAIGNLLSSLRTALFAKVGDTGLSASDLGITTTAWSSDTWRTEQGKLVLDEKKLLAALEKNPNAVQDFFTKIALTDSGATDTSTKLENGENKAGSGLLVRINALLSQFNTAMRTQNIINTQKAISGYTETMTDIIVKMAEKEESYWKKYSKLETMLSKLQSQQVWLSAQIGLYNSQR